MLTTEELAKVQKALTVANGNREQAAAALNIELPVLSQYIKRYRVLRDQWTEKRVSALPAHQAESAGVVTLLETEAQIADRRQGEYEKLIAEVGTDDVDLACLMSLQKAYGRYSEESYSMIGGTLIEQAMGLRKILNTLEPKIKASLEGTIPEGFTSISILYTECQKQLANIMEKVGGSLVVSAKIKALRESAKGGGKRKVSFGPKQTNVYAQNVQVKT